MHGQRPRRRARPRCWAPRWRRPTPRCSSALLVAGMFGSSATGATGRAVMGWFARAERGFALGIRQMALPLGGALASLTLPSLIDAGGLDAAFVALAGLDLTAAASRADADARRRRRPQHRSAAPRRAAADPRPRAVAAGRRRRAARVRRSRRCSASSSSSSSTSAASAPGIAAAALAALQLVGAARAHRGRAGARIARACASRCCAASPLADAVLLAAVAVLATGPGALLYPLLAVAGVSRCAGTAWPSPPPPRSPAVARAGTAMSLQNTIVSVGGALAPIAFGVVRRGDVVDRRATRPRARAAGGLRRPAPARGRGGRPQRSTRAPRARELPNRSPWRRHEHRRDRSPVRPGRRRRLRDRDRRARQEGGALRYRGVDIEELVGNVPYEQVWGLLVDGSFEPGLPPAEPHPLAIRSGDPRVDVQSALAMLAPAVGLQAAHRHHATSRRATTSRARRSWR